ncbi:MAG: hypothetical protein KBD78_01520 [Oligoflexales bacterium]|nr:hypothetical protein [Oligoflexales bacterium]
MKKRFLKSCAFINSSSAFIESSSAFINRSSAHIYRSKTLIFITYFLSCSDIYAQTVKYEPNFAEFPLLAANICSDTSTNNIEHTHIAQIFGYKYKLDSSTSTKKKSALNNDLDARAKKLAKKHRHLFYSFGFCTPDTIWLASFPISSDIIVTEKKITLPWQQINKVCNRVNYSIADENLSTIEHVNLLPKQDITMDKTKSVSIGISCLPSYVEQTGPLLLYLYLPNKDSSFPFQEMFDQEKNININPELTFIKWVNALRSRYKIKELHSNEDLLIMIKPLLKSETSSHFRENTSKLFDSAQKKKLKLLGENRALGSSLSQIAQHFWRSPSHRALLLNSRAEYIAFASKASESKTNLGLVVTAKSKD